MTERGRKRACADFKSPEPPLRSDGFLTPTADMSPFDLASLPYGPGLAYPDYQHFTPLFDSSPSTNPVNGCACNDMQHSMAKTLLGGNLGGYYPYDGYNPQSKFHSDVPRDMFDNSMKEDEGTTRAHTGLIADPSYVVPVGGFEVRVVVVQGRALYCANDVMMAVGIKTSVRSTLYKLREKHPDLCRVGVLTKLGGSITGQAMTCYPLRVCTAECSPLCQYEMCPGFKPLETILASLGRADIIKLFVMTELELRNFSNFIWPTPWWRERIKKAVAQRDLKRALNAANKRDRRDKLLHLADVACIAGSANRNTRPELPLSLS